MSAETTTRGRSRQQNSFFLSAMVLMSRSEEIIALGKKLVDQLNPEDERDTLTRWMSHYIAELIMKVENSTPDARPAAEKECSEAILNLWKHRAVMPDGKRPFEDLEPIVRAIESLDPESETHRYHKSIRMILPGAPVEPEPKVQTLFEFVRTIDDTARLVMGHALADAASAATDKSKEWVSLAEKASEDAGISAIVIRYILDKANVRNAMPDAADVAREEIEDRIKKLDLFVREATKVIDSLKAELRTLPISADVGNDEAASGASIDE